MSNNNPFDFINKQGPMPDFRRKVGEWKEHVKDASYVEAAAKYIRLGEGSHKATEIDEAFGLKEVYVGFFRTCSENHSPEEKDNTADDRTLLEIGLTYYMKDGREERLMFDIDFGGFGD